jgi:hypothetical protein
MKGRDDRAEALAWYLDFVNEDLDSLSDLEFEKRVVEAKFFLLNPGRPLFPREKTTPKQPPGELLFEVRGRGHIEYWPSDFDWEGVLKQIQSTLKDYLDSLVAQQAASGEIVKHVDLKLSRSSGKWVVVPELDMSDLADPRKLKGLARTVFCFVLDGIPVDSIKTCRECTRYFLHLSAKTKYYCSAKCTSRALSRKRREADPEGYRAKQREIMRRKYKRDQARKLGKSPDKVLIQKKSPPKRRTIPQDE